MYLLGKYTGAVSNSFSVNGPQGLSFGADSNLYVISSNATSGLNQILVYTNSVSGGPTYTLATTITTFSNALAVAAHPFNQNLLIVADGAGSQQVKGLTENGTILWTYGLLGGMPTNGVAVKTNSFWFVPSGGSPQAFLSYQWDGSFWLGDEGNSRALHFDPNQNYLEQIMYQYVSYNTCVDLTSPNRVFNSFKEFNVSYSNGLTWTYVANWAVGMPTNVIFDGHSAGLSGVVTLTNGRTYGTTYYWGTNGNELVELTNNFLRLTGVFPCFDSVTNRNFSPSLGTDGSIYYLLQYPPYGWFKATHSGFDANNNPTWSATTFITGVPRALATDPLPRANGNLYYTISTNNVIITYQNQVNNTWHFGGFLAGATNWSFINGPSANLNGLGNFEISNGVTYPGDMTRAVDNQVTFGYHGEFFRGEGQAGQTMHFLDDGLFVGEFGETSVGHNPQEGSIPGFAGNGYSPQFFKDPATGDYYYWINDESEHGPQLWHFVNARNIFESAGYGSLGSPITVTNPPTAFPLGLNVFASNNGASMYWSPVVGATSYNVYDSTNIGGPFLVKAFSTANTNANVSGLQNNHTYYFSVTAVSANIESVPSEQGVVTPYNPTNCVLVAGQLAEASESVYDMDVGYNPFTGMSNQSGLLGAEHLQGLWPEQDAYYAGYGSSTLANTSVGNGGWIIYYYSGLGPIG